MAVTDDLNPHEWSVEQQKAGFRETFVTELIRSALLSPLPSLLGAFRDPDNGQPLFPNLAAKNDRYMEANPQARR